MDYSKYEREFLQAIVNKSDSVSGVLKKLGITPSGEYHTSLSKFLRENNFDTKTLVGRTIKRYNNSGIPHKALSTVLCENGSGNSSKLKNRLIREGVKEYECEKCHNREWNGQPIPLELHHINGNHYDNRLENLIILCPNCHSQTSNFRGRHSQYDIELAKIAKQDASIKMDILKKQEDMRKNEVYQHKVKNGEINMGIKQPKTDRYCEQCGNLILGKGKRFCSHKCSEEFFSKNTYDKNLLLQQSLNVKSLIQLGKLYGVTDNAIKKHLIKLGILDEVRRNFKS